MENKQEKLVRYLQDAHAAETGIRKMLEGFVGDTHDPQVKNLFENHIALTRTHEERLEVCLKQLDQEPSGGKGFFNSMMAKMGDMIQGSHDEEEKNTQNLIKAYATEHLECAMYESLIAYSEAVGHQDIATVARSIQQEEKATAEQIWPMISSYAVTPLKNTTTDSNAYTA